MAREYLINGTNYSTNNDTITVNYNLINHDSRGLHTLRGVRLMNDKREYVEAISFTDTSAVFDVSSFEAEEDAYTLVFDEYTERITLNQALPTDVKTDTRFTVKFNADFSKFNPTTASNGQYTVEMELGNDGEYIFEADGFGLDYFSSAGVLSSSCNVNGHNIPSGHYNCKFRIRDLSSPAINNCIVAETDYVPIFITNPGVGTCSLKTLVLETNQWFFKAGTRYSIPVSLDLESHLYRSNLVARVIIGGMAITGELIGNKVSFSIGTNSGIKHGSHSMNITILSDGKAVAHTGNIGDPSNGLCFVHNLNNMPAKEE